MKLKLAGYEFVPKGRFQADLSEYLTTGGWAGRGPALPPSPAKPIYADEDGNHFLPIRSPDSIAALPFIPGSAASTDGDALSELGGFVPIEKMPRGAGRDALKDTMSGIVQGLPPQAASDWLGRAAKSAVLGAGPVGALEGVMKTLGLSNPAMSGPLAAALQAAGASAGLGPVGNLLPSVASMLAGGGPAALAKAMGAQGLNSLLSKAGLGSIPGMGAAGSILGGQLGGMLANGGLAGGLEELSNAVSGFLEGGCLDVPGLGGMGGPPFDPTGGGCFPGADAGGLNVDAISGLALDQASDQLLSQWQVDDESSAAEHIAHKAVMDNKGEIQQALKDEITGTENGGFSGLCDRIKGFFSGLPQGTGQPAVRMEDLDDAADKSIMGVGTILVEGSPVSRVTDMVGGPKAPGAGKQIVLGEPSVLSADRPTAFVDSFTEIPTKMVTGAPSVLVGGAVVAAMQEANADANTAGNAGPAGPGSPASTNSGSQGSEGSADGPGETTERADSVEGAAGEGSANEAHDPAGDNIAEKGTESSDAKTAGAADGAPASSSVSGAADSPNQTESHIGVSESPGSSGSSDSSGGSDIGSHSGTSTDRCSTNGGSSGPSGDSSSGSSGSGSGDGSGPRTSGPLQTLKDEQAVVNQSGLFGVLGDVSCNDAPEAYKNSPDDYACHWMHARNTCLTTRYLPGPWDFRAGLAWLGGIGIEAGQVLTCRSGWDTNLCRSANQKTDYPANLSGIGLALDPRNNERSCEELADDYWGGHTTSSLPEGDGTPRPYGPHYNRPRREYPNMNWLLDSLRAGAPLERA